MIKMSLLSFLLITFYDFGQVMETISYRDTTIDKVELNLSYYNFDYPICNQILDSPTFNPPLDGVYLKSTYGHRYISTLNNPNSKSDNHGGFDFWDNHTCDDIQYNESNPIDIICMCDGTIDALSGNDSTQLEATPEGRYVRVRCDKLSQSYQDTLFIYYRHLSSFGPKALEAFNTNLPVQISKGEIIGKMGSSGTTSNHHLHLSVETKDSSNTVFIHTARLFNPTATPQVLGVLDNVRIELLQDWTDSALFRVAWPFNQSINQFQFLNEDYSIIFNKEIAYETGSMIRDNYNCIENIDVFAYQFNGKQTAFERYQIEKDFMPPIYPASLQRDSLLETYHFTHFPLDSITLNKVSYVYDFMIKGLPITHLIDSFKVKLSDVWGYTVVGSFVQEASIENMNTSHSLNQIQLYPNPIHDELTISILKESEAKIFIINTLGQIIYSNNFQSKTNTISTKNFPPGVYFLHIQHQGEQIILKCTKI
jgi:hypothetical protein